MSDSTEQLIHEAVDLADEETKLEVDVSKLSSPVLRRLIEEVRHDEEQSVGAYNRWHNRHNRSR